MTLRLVPVLVALGVAGPALADPPKEPAVAYPVGYRQWAHVKSMVIFSDKHPLFAKFGGIHHVYVNAVGLRAMTKGGTFPDNSVLVFDLLDAKEENGAYVEGNRKLVAVMVRDRNHYKPTGGWGFETFKGDSRSERVVSDAVGECFGCHQQQQANDFVFSGYRP
jgi:hypothetical protein